MKEIRVKRGIKFADAVRKIGISESYYRKIETGKALPSVEFAKYIGEFYGVNWWEIFEEERVK